MVFRNAFSKEPVVREAIDGLAIEVLGGIRHFTGLFLGLSSSTVKISVRGRGV